MRSNTALERAFELAASGEVETLRALRKKLKAEGYSDEHLVGQSLIAQLRKIMKEAQESGRG